MTSASLGARSSDAAGPQLEAALQHMGPGDLANTDRCTRIGLDRVAGDHLEPAGARQLGNQVVGEGAGKAGLPVVAAEDGSMATESRADIAATLGPEAIELRVLPAASLPATWAQAWAS